MNRQEVLAAYTVSEQGVIASPGKFEGEMLYVPALWSACLDGCYSFDECGVYGTIFDDCDREEFPEIGESYGILMEESENGFVNVREFETREAYEAAIEQVTYCSDAQDEEGDEN
jgi:hypothetical protein